MNTLKLGECVAVAILVIAAAVLWSATPALSQTKSRPDPKQTVSQSDLEPKSSDAKTKGPTNTKQSREGKNSEEVFEAWWQYFSNDKEGLDNLKLAIIDCDPELRKTVQKWVDAAKAAGEQHRKAVKARNAVRPARYRADLAKREAAKAQPAEKEAKEKAATKAQEEADAAQKAAETESKKDIEADKALKEAEKNVDINVRKTVSEAAEKQIEKEKQERADEKPEKKEPQKTKQARVDQKATTKGAPSSCPPTTATTEPAPTVQEEQNPQSEASKKFRQNVPYGQPQTPPIMPPYGYGMGGYGTGADDRQKREERPPVTIPPYGYGTGGYDPPRPPWPGGPETLPAPPP